MNNQKEKINNIALSEQVLNQIKDELLVRKKQVSGDLKRLTEKDNHAKDSHRAKFPNYGDKPDDNAQEIGEYSTNLATEKVLESSLRDIENALDRIDKGTYGICRYCGKEIGEKRLLARPVASACVECKSRLQQAA